MPCVSSLGMAGVVCALDTADGVYMCIKNRDSRFLWANENFVRLVGTTKTELIGTIDTRDGHKEDDQKVMKGGKPLLNLKEFIDVANPAGEWTKTAITTQKGLLRKGNKICGVTVCFSLDAAAKSHSRRGGL